MAVDFFILCCVILSLSFFCFFFSLFILRIIFISLGMGLGLIFCWSENKICYFAVVCKYLRVGMELAIIIELFTILSMY